MSPSASACGSNYGWANWMFSPLSTFILGGSGAAGTRIYNGAGEITDGAISLRAFSTGSNAVIDQSGYVTMIPEPGFALLGGLGILAMLRRRRMS